MYRRSYIEWSNNPKNVSSKLMKECEKHLSPNYVPDIAMNGSEEKKLWDYFNNGTKAIQLIDDSRFETLWNKVHEFLTHDQSLPFWEDSIAMLSKNHISNRYDLGDMIRFFPSAWGHYARKMVLISNENSKDIKVLPKQFISSQGFKTLNQDVLRLAWDLASDVFYECLPKGFEPPEYSVSLQILKYPDSGMEFNKTLHLIKETSTGPWTKLGQKMDLIRNKILINSPFDLTIISGLFRYISMIPIVNLVLIPINKIFFKKYSHKLADHKIIGPAHIDSSRAFSMLIGNRDVIVTEVYDNKSWHELVLSPKSMHIFPGKYLSEKIGTKPTYHRYSISNKVENKGKRKPNITLLLGIVGADSVKS